MTMNILEDRQIFEAMEAMEGSAWIREQLEFMRSGATQWPGDLRSAAERKTSVFHYAIDTAMAKLREVRATDRPEAGENQAGAIIYGVGERNLYFVEYAGSVKFDGSDEEWAKAKALGFTLFPID